MGRLTFLDAKILKSKDVQTVEGVTYSLQGKVPQNVPKYTATLWSTYDFLDKWQVGGGPDLRRQPLREQFKYQ